MKELDENVVVGLMLAAIAPDRRSMFTADDVIKVVDLIFDYYEEAGLLDFDFDDEDDDPDADRRDAAAYVSRVLSADKNAPAFTVEEIAAMVNAEMDYEESLI